MALVPFADKRLAFCAQCGGPPTTCDHVPAKTFLDKPFPPDLPVVGMCHPCNSGASLDEEYVACAIEVVYCGSVDPDQLERPSVRRTLAHHPALAARIGAQLNNSAGGLLVEAHRVRRVIEKTARGVWAFETAEPVPNSAASVWFAPLQALTEPEHAAFEFLLPPGVFAEVGSRMMIRQALGLSADPGCAWECIQGGRFRYAVDVSDAGAVRIVLREYLVAEVVFHWS